jgi:hypothetical protein
MNCSNRRPICIAGIMLLSALVSPAATLSNCDEASLRQGISNGGTITFECDGTITLSATLVVERDTVLDGDGRQVMISGNDAVRVFEVNPGVRFSLRGLTIANGAVIGTNGVAGGTPGQDAFGAGILNRGGIVTVTDCFFRSNTLRGGVGGPGNFGIPNGTGGTVHGAAIDNDGGQVWATNCVFIGNSCSGGTGGANIVTAQGGDGGNAFGAAFYCDTGAYGFFACRFANNAAIGGASGGQGTSPYGTAGSAYGGAIASIQSTGVVSDALFIANQITGASLQWTGVRSGEARGGAVFNEIGQLSIDRTLLASNTAVAGSALRFGERLPARGGAVANVGTLMMSDSYVRNNAAIAGTSGADGIFAFGGALDNSGTAMVSRCTFQGNEARGGRGGGAGGRATPGGDAHGGAIYTTERLAATNCTLVGNVARGGDGSFSFQSGPAPAGTGNGGALATTGTTILSHISFGSNTAVYGLGFNESESAHGRGGGIHASTNAPILQNSILAYSQIGSNAFGALVDQGHNFSSDASCQFTHPGSRNNIDPLLSPLGDFDGPTPTMALLAGSPAINAALSSLCVSTDQRGRNRPFGTGCDVGAFESSPPFSVRGTIHGFRPDQGVSVQSGGASTVSDPKGNYILLNFEPGTHSVVPSSAEAVCIPNSRSVNVASDILGIDFKSYRFNGLTIDAVSAQGQTVVVAGRSGDVHEMQRSGSINGQWTSFSTNTVGTEGIFTLEVPSGGAGGFLRTRRLAP